MNELSIESWLRFAAEFIGHMLAWAFAQAGEERSLVVALDWLSEAMGLGEE